MSNLTIKIETENGERKEISVVEENNHMLPTVEDILESLSKDTSPESKEILLLVLPCEEGTPVYRVIDRGRNTWYVSKEIFTLKDYPLFRKRLLFVDENEAEKERDRRNAEAESYRMKPISLPMEAFEYYGPRKTTITHIVAQTLTDRSKNSLLESRDANETITTREARLLLETVTPLAKSLCFTKKEMLEILQICDKVLDREIQNKEKE